MGFAASLHWRTAAAIALVVAVGVPARGQPPPKTPAKDPEGTPGATAKPAGRSAVESSDVPPYRPSPARFAVTLFENFSNARAMDWLMVGVPYEIAEKAEDVLDLEPAGGPLHVGPAHIAPEPEPVAALATELDASYIVTGWVDRANWNLRIALTLWKVTPGKPATAVVVAETQKTGDPKNYHQLVADAAGQMWSKGLGITIDADRVTKLARPLANDLYAFNRMARGLGLMTGAFGAVNLKAAQVDLEKAVFIDPKFADGHRAVGELYNLLATADPKQGGDPHYAGRAAGKFAYANDLAPDRVGMLRAAATSAARAGKHELARDILRKYVTRKPWVLEARFEYGAALWHTGDVERAEKQLKQVTSHLPDHLQARRMLALVHAARGDTSSLVSELEAIAVRAPGDLEIKADLATAYGSLNRWDRAIAQLEVIATAEPTNLALAVRIGDAHRRMGDLDGALAAYARGSRIAPWSSYPGFLAAQALFDAGRINEAVRAYTNLQKYRDEVISAEHALGALALMQNRASDAAWYLRRVVKANPRDLTAWRSMIAAELARHDTDTANKQIDRALAGWPEDGQLFYLAGVSAALTNDREQARTNLTHALELEPTLVAARSALDQLQSGAAVTLQYRPELVRPWGDGEAIAGALRQFAASERAMAELRAGYQNKLLEMLAALGKGPKAPYKAQPVRNCPLDRVAPLWAAAQRDIDHFARRGLELEAAYRFIARHHEIGATAALLPSERTRVSAAFKSYRTALADSGELIGEWQRGLGPELRFAGCSERLLAAAVRDPERYRLIEADKPEVIPKPQPPRPRPRATFYVDNTRCPDAVDVWIDGVQLGQVAPGRRSALVAQAGERTLCLIVPGAAQCGDRGTMRQVYLHDGWSTTLHCPK